MNNRMKLEQGDEVTDIKTKKIGKREQIEKIITITEKTKKNTHTQTKQCTTKKKR